MMMGTTQLIGVRGTWQAGGRASMALTGGAAGVLLLAWAVSRLLRRQPKRE